MQNTEETKDLKDTSRNEGITIGQRMEQVQKLKNTAMTFIVLQDSSKALKLAEKESQKLPKVAVMKKPPKNPPSRRRKEQRR